MDGEFITIMGAGVVFILLAVGALVYQRRQAAPPEEASKGRKTRRPPAAAAAAKKSEAPAKNVADKPRSILSSLSAIGIGDKSGPTKSDLTELEHLVEAGQIEEAARVAMRLTLWDRATQLYLKIEQHGNAAHCAKRADKFEMAAELYEKAEDIQNAVIMWERAGNGKRARQLSGKGTPPAEDGDESELIQIGKELQKNIDLANEKKDHMRASELYEQAGDKENAAEQFAIFAQTARRPEMYAEKIERLSARVAYNLLRTATKGRPPAEESAQLYRRLAMLQHHFGNTKAALDTLEKLDAAAPGDAETEELLDELNEIPSLDDDSDTFDALVAADAGLDADLDAGLDVGTAQPDAERVTGMGGGLLDAMEVELDADLAHSSPDGATSAAGAAAPTGASSGVVDEAVEAARTGPTIAELVAMIGDQPCDLGNIEVFYRLGLACLAFDRIDDARNAFEAVSEASPGYRDTEKRLEQL